MTVKPPRQALLHFPASFGKSSRAYLWNYHIFRSIAFAVKVVAQ